MQKSDQVKQMLRETLDLLDDQERARSDALTEEFEQKRKVARDQAAWLLKRNEAKA